MTNKTPDTMRQTARLRARQERQSVTWDYGKAEDGTPVYTVYGRPGYWRVVDNRIPVGTKAGGFVKSVVVKAMLNDRYAGNTTIAHHRAILAQIKSEDFMKETVS